MISFDVNENSNYVKIIIFNDNNNFNWLFLKKYIYKNIVWKKIHLSFKYKMKIL